MDFLQSLTITQIYYAIILTAIVIAIPASYHLDKKYQEIHNPGYSYKWGLYCGVIWLIIGAVILIGMVWLYAMNAPAFSFKSTAGVLVPIAMLFLGWLTVQRNRWALVLISLISLNPLFIIINGIYLRNRWKQLSNNPSLINL